MLKRRWTQYQNQILSQFLVQQNNKIKIGAEIMAFIDLSTTVYSLWFASWCTSDEAVFDT